MLAHEKLHAYRKSLAFAGSAASFITGWERRRAVADQLTRATDSLVLNLAEGARLRAGPGKLRSLDYAMGSCLECAACLDIAQIKGLLGKADTVQEKQRLSEIMKMMVGLRKAWESWKAHDDSAPYTTEVPDGYIRLLFHHETLEVYGASLKLMQWFVALPDGRTLSSRAYRQIDENLTSIVLNIAEGNGRYSELDHRRFLDIAEASVAKTAACLDLVVQKGKLEQAESAPGKDLLGRIAAMLSRM